MSRNFGGTADYYELTTAPAVTPMTLSIWAKLPATSGVYVTLSTGHFSTANTYQYINVSAGAINSVTRAPGGATVFGTKTGVPTDTWFHSAGVFASSTSRISYLNGVAGTENTTDATASINRTLIGVRRSTSTLASYMAGLLAEAAIWTAALSAGEIAALAAGVNPRLIRPESLWGYWPLLGLVNPEPDWSGNVRNITVAGTPAFADHAPVTLWAPRFVSVSLPAPPAAPITATADVDAAVLKAFTGTAGLDAAALKAFTGTADLAAVLQKQNLLATATIDSALMKARTLSVDLAAAIQKQITAAAGLESALRAAKTAGVDVDATVKALALTRTAGIDAFVGGGFSMVSNLQAALAASVSTQTTLNGVLAKAMIFQSQLNAALLKAPMLQAQIDSALALRRSITAGTDAVLVFLGSVAAQISAAVRQGKAHTAALDALLGEVILLAAASDRHLALARESRRLSLHPESRTIAIPGENRLLDLRH